MELVSDKDMVPLEMRMRWPEICKIAVACRVKGMTLDEFSHAAIAEGLARLQAQPVKKKRRK